jgi:prepilin-type N-terminal cleavage/methylation domain-containing protein
MPGKQYPGLAGTYTSLLSVNELDRRIEMNHNGFTLIVLLIVVAIIAILAAIAVPNFLEAQTRAKVSRTKSDMRSMATAAEMYRVDYNYYPYSANDGWWLAGTGYTGPLVYTAFEAFRAATTPIAYITTVPPDVFNLKGNVFPGEASYIYTTEQHTDYSSGHTTDWTWVPDPGWGLGSIGPNRAWNNAFGPGTVDVVINKLYEPTNGTISLGDIIRAGPGEERK